MCSPRDYRADVRGDISAIVPRRGSASWGSSASDTNQYVAPDALAAAGMMLSLYDEQQRVIGAITHVSLDPDGYRRSGVVRGLAPGDCPVADSPTGPFHDALGSALVAN